MFILQALQKGCAGIFSLILYNYLISAISCFVILKITEAVYNIKVANYKITLLYVLSGAFFMGTALNVGSGINNNDKTIIILIIAFLLNVVVLKLKLLHSLAVTGIIFIIAAVGDFISFMILVRTMGYSLSYVQNSLLLTSVCNGMVYLLSFIFIIFVRRKYFVYGFQNLRKMPVDLNTVLFIVIALVLIFLNFYFIFNVTYEDDLMHMIYSAVFLAFLIFGLIFIIVSNRLKVKEKENRELRIYIRTIGELSEELRRFKHNYLNILHGISGYIELRDWEKLGNYVDELVHESKKLKRGNLVALQKIGDPGLYGLLASKISQAESAGIEVKFAINGTIEETVIKKHELCEVIGIYLDNAIEAVRDLKEKKIGIELIQNDGHVVIKVNNNIDSLPAPVNQLNQKNYSSKGKNRGSGLWLADRILVSYRNVLHNTIVEDNIFMQELIIPFKNKQG